MQNIIDWKFRPNRFRRLVSAAARWTRNGLAALGVCFLYLLVVGYLQYLDQVREGTPHCMMSRCT
ncbi:hypothetical protein [Burkholderia plantarii]|uniref:Uncharacterized protein n=1 Tax=Burkholderia plantarii TaxID=41899 RepID=A0A0B6RYN9_BURPL|nr:hypothetical protein [Burkholderia plantarii]AJK46190.1 hypothetical protein BGL_1c16810 [Burkholderia plantarii]